MKPLGIIWIADTARPQVAWFLFPRKTCLWCEDVRNKKSKQNSRKITIKSLINQTQVKNLGKIRENPVSQNVLYLIQNRVSVRYSFL